MNTTAMLKDKLEHHLVAKSSLNSLHQGRLEIQANPLCYVDIRAPETPHSTRQIAFELIPDISRIDPGRPRSIATPIQEHMHPAYQIKPHKPAIAPRSRPIRPLCSLQGPIVYSDYVLMLHLPELKMATVEERTPALESAEDDERLRG